MTIRDPFVVANGQMYVMTAHRMVNGVVTVSTPNFSARIPDVTRPTFRDGEQVGEFRRLQTKSRSDRYKSGLSKSSGQSRNCSREKAAEPTGIGPPGN